MKLEVVPHMRHLCGSQQNLKINSMCLKASQATVCSFEHKFKVVLLRSIILALLSPVHFERRI